MQPVGSFPLRQAAPIEAEEFAQWMAALAPFEAERRMAVGVSGGADSLCLAWLARGWGQPLALIVDHGLRVGSAAEAAITADRLAGFGVPSQVLRLGLEPGPALAERARRARYAALEQAALAAGRVDLLLGHHAADQVETRQIRALSGSRGPGLAGMAAVAEHRFVRRLRPLLGVRPERLRATLVGARLGWVEDPSNHDPAGLRARLRARLTPAELLREAAACGVDGAARRGADAELAAILAERASLWPEGFAVLTPGPIAPEALAALLRALSGADYPPSTQGVARMAANVQPGTLAGIRVLPAGRLGPGWLLVREPACAAPPVPAWPGAVWDRRFRLEGNVPAGLLLGRAGKLPSALRRRAGLPAAVTAVLPALWMQGKLAAVPHLAYSSVSGLERVTLAFQPVLPAAGAPFGTASGDGDAVRSGAPHLRMEANASDLAARGQDARGSRWDEQFRS